MTRMYMIDTNTVSYIARGRSKAARTKLLSLHDDSIGCISAITEAEIRYGLAKRPQATALQRLMDAFLATIRILPWGREEAQAYGQVRAKLEAAGFSLASMDMMIAAHAVAMGAVLVTNDKAFSRVKDLYKTVNWATDV